MRKFQSVVICDGCDKSTIEEGQRHKLPAFWGSVMVDDGNTIHIADYCPECFSAFQKLRKGFDEC